MTSPDLRPGPAAGEAADAAPAVPDPSARRRRAIRLLDRGLRVTGGVLSVVAAVLSAGLEIVTVPLRVQGHLVGVSILLAVVVNLALARLAYESVGRRWAVGLPWLTWTAVMFLAAGAVTTEGDHLLSGSNWVPVPMILAGSLAFGSYTYRLLLRPVPRATPVPPPAG